MGASAEQRPSCDGFRIGFAVSDDVLTLTSFALIPFSENLGIVVTERFDFTGSSVLVMMTSLSDDVLLSDVRGSTPVGAAGLLFESASRELDRTEVLSLATGTSGFAADETCMVGVDVTSGLRRSDMSILSSFARSLLIDAANLADDSLLFELGDCWLRESEQAT